MSREEILSAISELSVLELSDLINDMEEKFGVSAAAAVAVAAPAAAAADADDAEEQTEFDVVLSSFGVAKDEAEELKKQLEDAGGTVEVK